MTGAFKEECRMKRSFLTAVGIMALTLSVPGVALAHHSQGDHHRHGPHTKAHHAKFHFMHIGAGSTTTTTSTTAPTTPTTPASAQNAGTVTSYTGSVLTLTLADGSTVSGKVTTDTRIGCVKAPSATSPTGTTPTGDNSPGDDQGQGDDQSRGDMSERGEGKSGDSQHGDHGDNDGEEGTPGVGEPPCDSSALVAGAVVRAAELRIGPSGNEFESVWLVR
jgi:hypothetical protein